MSNVVAFDPNRKRKKKLKKKKLPRVRRGVIAGLLTIEFLADMLGLKREALKKYMYRELKDKGVESRDMSPRQLGEFIEFIIAAKKDRKGSRDIDDLLF